MLQLRMPDLVWQAVFFFDILLFSAEDCLMSLLRRLDSCNSLPFSLGGWFSSPLCKSWSYMRWQCWLLGFGCLGSTAFFIMKIILADSCGSLWGLQLREPHWDRIPVIKRLQTKRGYKLATKRCIKKRKKFVTLQVFAVVRAMDKPVSAWGHFADRKWQKEVAKAQWQYWGHRSG